MGDDFSYHIHHHASLVIPPDLAQARISHAHKGIDDQTLAAAVKSAITDVFLRQSRLGLTAWSDGEFRRRNDLSVAYDAIEGFGAPLSTPVAELIGPAHAAEVRPLLGTPAARGRLVQEEGAQLGALLHRTMIALPSPGFLMALTAAPDQSAAAGFAEILRAEILELVADGVDLVLLRNPVLAFLLVAKGRAVAEKLGIDVAATIAAVMEIEVAAADLDVPKNFQVGLDLTTAGHARGPWDRSAVHTFLATQPYGRLCVDFPADPADQFPLDLVPPDLVMSLGIVDITEPKLENVGVLVDRVEEVARVIGTDDLALSANGGFHIVGDAAAPYEQDKLQLVETVARYYWSDED